MNLKIIIRKTIPSAFMKTPEVLNLLRLALYLYFWSYYLIKSIFNADGLIYFIEGNSVNSDFGFPRVNQKKKFRW